MVGFGAIGEHALGEATPLEEALKKTLTETGLVRIVNGHSPLKMTELRGRTIDEAAQSIARSLPIYAPRRSGIEKAKKKVGSRHAKAMGPRGDTGYWPKVKAELFLLFCTKDKKYAPLRTRLSKEAGATQLTMVGWISSAVTAYLGLAVAAAVPLVALCLYVAMKIGVNALCANFDQVTIK